MVITVEEAAPADDYTITISGYDDIYKGDTETYTATIYNNGLPSDEHVTFAVFADDKTSPVANVSIVSQNGTSANIKSEASSGYMQLKATLNIDSNVFAWKRIRLRNF